MEIVIADSHPAFPQPSNPNIPIWRYLAYDKFESLVWTRTLYMRRADKFPDDSFEGTTPAGEIAAWERLAAAAPTAAERDGILHSMKQRGEYAAHFQQTFYINCWHMSEHENVAMWDRYTKGTSEAVAIKTRYAVFKELLRSPVHHVGAVRYIDYDIDPLPSVNMMHRIMHKRIFFQDEREVRVVMWALGPHKGQFIDPYLTSDGFGYAPPIDVKKLVQAVILHPRATREFADRVAALCMSHGLPSPEPSKMASDPKF